MLIALTGFMMSGKTTYGIAASRMLGVPFIDLDDVIEEGSTPGQIIAAKGEAEFRRMECKALERITSEMAEGIIALGGGTVMNENNRRLLKQHCTTIFLYAPLELTVFHPAYTHCHATRPLLQSRTKDEIYELFESRLPAYKDAADITIATGYLSEREVIERIMEIYRTNLSR